MGDTGPWGQWVSRGNLRQVLPTARFAGGLGFLLHLTAADTHLLPHRERSGLDWWEIKGCGLKRGDIFLLPLNAGILGQPGLHDIG